MHRISLSSHLPQLHPWTALNAAGEAPASVFAAESDVTAPAGNGHSENKSAVGLSRSSGRRTKGLTTLDHSAWILKYDITI